MNAIRSEPLPSDHHQWSVECSTSAYLDSEIVAVNDPANPPKEIAWAFPFLDEYWKTDDGEDLPYPGDFNRFKHPDGFRILRVDYDALPAGVRRWREEEMETAEEMDRKLIAVLDGVAFFAPGVVTYLMPLFATADVVGGHSACEDELMDLTNYHDPVKRRTDSARFVFRYGGRSQVGNSIRVQTVAQKEIKDQKTGPGKDEL
ncbi:hypothetical protein BO94DRAFT_620649 [Aspergillus sclerotioniger CBS 115572]|uniref:Uncharacterized protein n=1 Tax=Aspergillus sclerotioniger CBS 115572 TaxID=1450535 RepID=A0A317XBW1_9EURO|nr:hypothetical protein BO94DRAFT_620649 [Aspergillus sclerotioniger CBS 115572]PWY95172.1 hypothetical protein BO94DRAFT_620649 [Aspergillus sclerotioniger CBS 115572]